MARSPGFFIKSRIKPPCLALILVLALLLSGCTDYAKQIQDRLTQSSDPVIRRSMPYIEPVDPQNASLRAMAASIVAGGPPGDKEYEVNQLYRYVVEQYSYYGDPRSRDYIQPPAETIAIRGGDCEDLAILLCSLLENLGIRTYLVLTDTHAYCLAGGVDAARLKGYAEQALLEQVARDNNAKGGGNSMIAGDGKLYSVDEERTATTIKGGYVWYFGGNGSPLADSIRSLDCQYTVESSSPVSVYYVPSGSDYEAICRGRPFNFYPGTEAHGIVRLTGSCKDMHTNGGLVLKNEGREDAAVTVDVKKYTNYATDDILAGMQFNTYAIDNQTCVVVDPTAGKYGYPGYSQKNATGEKLAIDPVTKKYYYLG